VRGPESSVHSIDAIEEIGAPYRLIRQDPLGSRLGSAMRLGTQQSKLDPRSVLQVTVLEADLEPMPDKDRDLVVDEGM
jgi:hypothetical protein